MTLLTGLHCSHRPEILIRTAEAPDEHQPYRCTACSHRFDHPDRPPAKLVDCPRCHFLAASVALHSAPCVWVGQGREPK